MSVLIGEIYRSSLIAVVVVMIFAIVIWGYIKCICMKSEKRELLWRKINICLTVVSVFLIFYCTILNRNMHVKEVILIPFYSFHEAIKQPEYYRVMLMNVFLFEPLGLVLPFALPNTVYKKVTVAIIFSFLLSLGIELMQYTFSLGRAEVDDVICNTLGCALGTGAYLIRKYRENKRIREKNIDYEREIENNNQQTIQN